MFKNCVLFIVCYLLVISVPRAQGEGLIIGCEGASYTVTAGSLVITVNTVAGCDLAEAQDIMTAWVGVPGAGLPYPFWSASWDPPQAWDEATCWNGVYHYVNGSDLRVVLYVKYEPGLGNVAGCLGGCSPGYDDLVAACGGVDYVAEWDEELCEGWCRSCEVIANAVIETCAPYDPVGFVCKEYYDEPTHTMPYALDITLGMCGSYSCDDHALDCNLACGGTENVKAFSCYNEVVSIPCECLPGGENYNDEDWQEPTDDILDPEADEPDSTQTDNAALQNISENAYEIANSSHIIAENTEAIAINTEQIGKVLDKELTDIDNSLKDMKAEMEKSTPDIDTDGIGIISDATTSYGEGLVSDLSDEYASVVTGSTDDLGVDGTDISPIFTFVEDIFPSYSTECIPIDWNISVMGTNRQIYIGCDIANIFKGVMAFLMYVYTIHQIVGTIYSNMSPIGSGQTSKGR